MVAVLQKHEIAKMTEQIGQLKGEKQDLEADNWEKERQLIRERIDKDEMRANIARQNQRIEIAEHERDAAQRRIHDGRLTGEVWVWIPFPKWSATLETNWIMNLGRYCCQT